MSDLRGRVERVLSEVLRLKGTPRGTFALEDALYETGVGLDSLDAATFSVLLEREFGKDPYRARAFPQTLGDVISFYEHGEGA